MCTGRVEIAAAARPADGPLAATIRRGTAVLVLTRKIGEGIVLGGNVQLKVLRISGSRVTIGIEAPQSVRVLRADVDHEPTDERSESTDAPAPGSPADTR